MYSWKYFADIFLTLRHDLTHFTFMWTMRKTREWRENENEQQWKVFSNSNRKKLTFLIILIAVWHCTNFRYIENHIILQNCQTLINLSNYLLQQSSQQWKTRTLNNSISILIRLVDFVKEFSLVHGHRRALRLNIMRSHIFDEMEKWSCNASVIILITLNISGIRHSLAINSKVAKTKSKCAWQWQLLKLLM